MTSCLHACRNRAGWLTISILLFTQVNLSVGKEIDGDRLLDPSRLIEVRINLPAEDWEILCGQSRSPAALFSGLSAESPYTKFKADIWIDGAKIDSVNIRKKGFFGSVDAQRPSLKIKLESKDGQHPVNGLNRLTLNNNKQDLSQLSQFLTYQLFRKAGNPAPRSNWAHVIVNGESLGIYSNVESIDKPFLARNFKDKTGNLYEGTVTDFHPRTIGKLEVKTNKVENDLSDIERLAKLLSSSDDLDLEELGRVIDLDVFYRHWALEALTGFWDGYSANQNNYFVYFNPKDNGRGQFIPWGADWGFTSDGPFAGGSFGQGTPEAIYAQSILANRLYYTAEGPKRYRATVRQLLDDVWDEEEMLAEIDRVEKLVSPHLHSTQAGAPQALDKLRDFIRGRRELVERALENWRPNIPSEPRTPTYVVDVGKVIGSFSTTFSDGGPEQLAASKSDLKIELNGKPLEPEQVSVSVQRFQFPGSSSFGGPPGGGFGGPFGASRGRGDTQAPPVPVSLALVVERSGGQPITASVMIDRDKFTANSEKPIRVMGVLQEGRGNGFGFGGGPSRFIHGELQLTNAGIDPGDEVAGSLDLKIVETHGGPFSRSRPGGRGAFRAPSVGGPLPTIGLPRPLTLQHALDVDRNGTISSQEIEQAATALKQLDLNHDGNLTENELQNPPRRANSVNQPDSL